MNVCDIMRLNIFQTIKERRKHIMNSIAIEEDKIQHVAALGGKIRNERHAGLEEVMRRSVSGMKKTGISMKNVDAIDITQMMWLCSFLDAQEDNKALFVEELKEKTFRVYKIIIISAMAYAIRENSVNNVCNCLDDNTFIVEAIEKDISSTIEDKILYDFYEALDTVRFRVCNNCQKSCINLVMCITNAVIKSENTTKMSKLKTFYVILKCIDFISSEIRAGNNNGVNVDIVYRGDIENIVYKTYGKVYCIKSYEGIEMYSRGRICSSGALSNFEIDFLIDNLTLEENSISESLNNKRRYRGIFGTGSEIIRIKKNYEEYLDLLDKSVS